MVLFYFLITTMTIRLECIEVYEFGIMVFNSTMLVHGNRVDPLQTSDSVSPTLNKCRAYLLKVKSKYWEIEYG